uniref:Uncharacterized protein n=1 Tax=Anopheles minimus TaxID=112268 RepID=A0A182WJP4_9DIPT
MTSNRFDCPTNSQRVRIRLLVDEVEEEEEEDDDETTDRSDVERGRSWPTYGAGKSNMTKKSLRKPIMVLRSRKTAIIKDGVITTCEQLLEGVSMYVQLISRPAFEMIAPGVTQKQWQEGYRWNAYMNLTVILSCGLSNSQGKTGGS